MEAFLENILIMPTGIFSILLGFLSLYWGFVFIGVADLDLFDGADGLEGAIDGGIEGASETVAEIAAEAAAEATAEAASEAVAEAAAEAGAEAVAEGATESLGDIGSEVEVEGISDSVGLLSALKLRSVPITVSASLIVLLSWTISYFMVAMVMTSLPFGAFINATLTFLLALFCGTLATSVLVRPFDGAFETNQGERDIDLIGSIGVVSTSKVNDRFGEIKIKSRNGTPLIMMARCDHDNALTNGDEVLVISIDKERNALIVEPIQSIVAQKVQHRLSEWKKRQQNQKT
ncbi:MAG: hypothetical protein CL916_13585 [Deltaproteobacteria bacterium]|nr:hypothetical protein [Deltaproteobacteria bacterium]